MGVHGSEIVHAIRAALAGEVGDPFVVSPQAPTQGDIRIESNPEQGWENRDGKLTFDVVGRDWFRAFRITVEALPSTDSFEGEMGDWTWRVAE
jgi:hypothetical protein